jgi:hypothetical protein
LVFPQGKGQEQQKEMRSNAGRERRASLTAPFLRTHLLFLFAGCVLNGVELFLLLLFLAIRL